MGSQRGHSFGGGLRRGYALGHLVACPPAAAILFRIHEPLPAVLLMLSFSVAVLVWRQERTR
jgi:hypothetical protein